MRILKLGRRPTVLSSRTRITILLWRRRISNNKFFPEETCWIFQKGFYFCSKELNLKSVCPLKNQIILIFGLLAISWQRSKTLSRKISVAFWRKFPIAGHSRACSAVWSEACRQPTKLIFGISWHFNKHLIFLRSLKAPFHGKSVKISDYRAFSLSETVRGWRAFRHF